MRSGLAMPKVTREHPADRTPWNTLLPPQKGAGAGK